MAIKPFRVTDKPRYPGICITGYTGVGKTTLASTMPGNGLIIDVPTTEGGSFVIPENRAHRIGGVRLDKWDDLEEVYQAILSGNTDALELPATPLNWIAIDSITGLANLAREKTIGDRPSTSKTPKNQVSLQEWGWIGNLVGWEVPKWQALPYAVIWLAQERVHGGYDDGGEDRRIGPNITAAALKLLIPPMTLIGRLTVEGDKERRVLTVGPPGGDYIVKVRAIPGRKLPNRIQDPHLGQILKYLYFNGPAVKRAKEDDIF